MVGYSSAVPGLCDVCGQRFLLRELRMVYVLGRATGTLACWSCHDPEHPQLDTRHVRTDDKQLVKNSRSDAKEREGSRRLWAWDPVGTEGTSIIEMKMGTVTVTVT